MRILWIQRRAADDDGGDSVYDRKLQGALAAAHDVTPYALKRNARLRQLASAALRVSPPEQFGFGDAGDVDNVRRMMGEGYDAVVFSHEHLDAFAAALRPHATIPFIALRHNVSSDAMTSILRDRPLLSGLYGALARAQERRALSGDLFQAISAISTRDRQLLGALSGKADIGLVFPGAPPPTPLADTATFARDVVLTGTFDWFPKARDLRRFAQDWSAVAPAGFNLHVSAGVPDDIARTLNATPERGLDYSDAIRIGVITDRFTAGHKLKTAAYLMQNCAVVSFAPVIHDFDALPHARRWIVEASSVADIPRIVETMQSRPIEALREELKQLKGEIGTQFAWSAQANALSTLIERTRRRS